MEEISDLKENSENNLNSQAYKVNTFLSWGVILAFFALFTVMSSSTLFVLTNSQAPSVFTRDGENVQNTQNASVFNISDPTTEVQNSNDNIVPVKVILYKDPFADIELKAQAVCVIDTVTGKILYERNKNTRMPLASLTKVMMALVATDAVGGDESVTISVEDIEKEGNSGLFLDEKWKLANLLDFTLMTSSNDGASAIASTVGAFLQRQGTTTSLENPKKTFIKEMHEKAQALELAHLEFNNESGLDISNTQSGAYGTAYEVAMLFEYVFKNKPNLLKVTTNEILEINSENNIVHTAKNTNEFVGSFPGLLASKTGYTDMAGGNLGVIFDSGIGSPIVMIVLGSTIDGRFEDIMKLYEASIKEVGQEVY